MDTIKKGEENKPYDQFKDKKTTYNFDVYSTKLPEVITKEMEKKGKRLEVEIGQGHDEEQILRIADETSPSLKHRNDIEEKLFAAAVNPNAEGSETQKSTSK